MPELGQTGIPFGGGGFQWTGTGWFDPATGRTWDPYGNPVQPQQPTTPALQYQQAYASPLVDWWRTHSGTNVNAFNFNKLKSSTQELALGAAEAAGHDRQDVYEDIQRTLPRATGPKTGYIAPLASR